MMTKKVRMKTIYASYVMMMVSQKFVLGASSTNLKKSKQESSAQLI